MAEQKMYQWHDVQGVKTPADQFVMDNAVQRTLADFKGQVVLLNLWATWCTPCLKELPTLDTLEETYAAEGLVVVPLSVDTLPYSQLRGFVSKLKLELPHLAQDTKGVFNGKLSPRGLPATYLIDRQGVIRASFMGSTDWMGDEQRKKVEALLNEPEAR